MSDRTSPDAFVRSRAEPSGRVWRVGTLVYSLTGLVALFGWLLWGDFAWFLKERTAVPVVQLLLKKFQASGLSTGLLIGAMPGAISVIFGPIVAYRSDRHRGRWGRRIPYLMIWTPLAGFALAGLAFSPEVSRSNVTVLGSIGLFWTLFECSSVVTNVIFNALINDVVPESILGRFYGLFRAISLCAGMIFNFFLMGRAEAHYGWLFAGIGALYCGGFILMCVKVKEGDYPPPDEAAENVGFMSATRRYCVECFFHPYYRWVFGAYALSMMAFVPVNLFSIFYAQSLSMGMGLYGKYVSLQYMISFLLSYFLGALADKFHPLRVVIIVVAINVPLTLWAGFFAANPNAFAFAFTAHGVLAGAYFSASASLGQRLYPRAKFAQFSSAAAVILAVGGLLISSTAGKLLDLTHNVYRYTFFVSLAVSLPAIFASIEVYRRFLALGGPTNYRAPDAAQLFDRKPPIR